MEEPSITTFGKVLRLERKRKELNQTQLAELVGTTQQNIGNWEAGRNMPKQDAFEKLIEVFGANSPLALLPPKGEIRLESKGVLASVQEESKTRKPIGFFAEASRLGFEAAQEIISPMSRNSWLEKCKKLLPPELYQNVERRLDTVAGPLAAYYRADYLSDKACIEIKMLSGQHIIQASRSAMYMALLQRTLLGDSNRKHLVMLVLTDPADAFGGNTAQRIFYEASQMGLDVRFFTTIQSAIECILRIENDQDLTYDDNTDLLDY